MDEIVELTKEADDNHSFLYDYVELMWDAHRQQWVEVPRSRSNG